jgi:hypothetical protein
MSRFDVPLWPSYCLKVLLYHGRQELVTTLTEAISIIRYRYNAARPVNRLSPEILAVIFGMVQERPSDYRPAARPSIYRWLVVTSVCRYWRETAITFSSLWTSINICDYRRGCQDATRTFLERSAAAPLRVYYARPERWNRLQLIDKSTLELVASASTRFREFHMTPRLITQSSVWEHFRHPAPLLESLTLGSSAGGDHDFVLPTLFANSTPCLKKLTMQYFCSWPGNNFVNLTHITLYQHSEANRQPLAQFLDFLRASPLLEELALIEAEPQYGNAASLPGDLEPVILNHLRVLEIGDWQGPEQISTFVCRLVLPFEVDIHIWGEEIELIRDNADVSTLYPANASHTARLRDLTKLRISIPPENRSSSFQAILVSGSTLDMQGHFNASQVLPIASICSLLTINEMWLTFHRVAPTVQEYKELFGTMLSLKMLLIQGISVRAILNALGRSSPLQDVNTPPLCPNLDTLHLYGEMDQCPLILHTFAEHRAKHGQPIRQLRAEKLTIEDLDCLRTSIADAENCKRSDLHALRKSIWPPVTSIMFASEADFR